jgi:hypothetical protein
MKTKIYALCEPGGEIRYIGKTIRTLVYRLAVHLCTARRGERNHRCNWIRSVFSRGYLPKIELIGEVEGDGCKEEIFWIAYGRQEGWRLVNETAGGEGASHKFSYEHRQNIAKAKTGQHHSEETRKKLRLFQSTRIRKPHSAGTRLKISDGLNGHVVSEKTRTKLSESGKRAWVKIKLDSKG